MAAVIEIKSIPSDEKEHLQLAQSGCRQEFRIFQTMIAILTALMIVLALLSIFGYVRE